MVFPIKASPKHRTPFPQKLLDGQTYPNAIDLKICEI
jgi:hypothetical protein